jgi:CHY zinc finger
MANPGPPPPPLHPLPLAPCSGVAKPEPQAASAPSRRAGKYTHPYGGMRRFAEDRARHSGWDVTCLSFDAADVRKSERNKVSDSLADQYKEAFIRINIDQAKGRPKANNISAAKKTVKMIAERVLLALEARATQVLFSESVHARRPLDIELNKLRQIDACGQENPKLTYETVRELARKKLISTSDQCMSDEFLPGEKFVKPETAVPVANVETPDMNELVDDDAAVREGLKQALVEMRAEEMSKGLQPTLISTKWVEQLTAAARELVQENYSAQYAPNVEPSVRNMNSHHQHDILSNGHNNQNGSPGAGASTLTAGDSTSTAGASVLGCPHFRRKNRVLMACCGTFPVCRMCHFQDQSRIHDIRIEPVVTLLCVPCGNIQPKAQSCNKCHVKFGEYYCDVCGITDDPKGANLRHCDSCNVCMPGMTFHCELCKACFALPIEDHFQAVHGHTPQPQAQPHDIVSVGLSGLGSTIGNSQHQMQQQHESPSMPHDLGHSHHAQHHHHHHHSSMQSPQPLPPLHAAHHVVDPVDVVQHHLDSSLNSGNSHHNLYL